MRVSIERARRPLWDDRVAMAIPVPMVNDHAGYRRVERRLLEAEGSDIIGQADGPSAVTAAARLRPDLVVLTHRLADARVAGFVHQDDLSALARCALAGQGRALCA